MKTYSFPLYLFAILLSIIISTYGIEKCTQWLLLLAQKYQEKKAAKAANTPPDQTDQGEDDPGMGDFPIPAL